MFFGYDAPDTFQDSLQIISYESIYAVNPGIFHFAYNSVNTQINGFCRIDMKSNSSIYFCDGADSASVNFYAPVLIGNDGANALEFSRNAHFHSGAPISLSETGWFVGELRFRGVMLDDSLSIQMDDNEKGNSLYIDQGSIFNSKVNCSAQSIYIGNSTFNDSTSFVKIGPESNQPRFGPIITNAPFSLTNSGTGSFLTALDDSCSFRSDLSLINTDEGSIDIASNGLLLIGGNLNISTSAGRVALGEYSTDTNIVQGNIDLNCTGGLVVLGMIKQGSSGTINTTSFANSELDLLGFRSTNTDSLIFTGTDNSRLVLNQCQIQGPLNVELPSIVTNGGIYHGNTLFHKTGSDYDQGGGSMVFHGKAHFKTSSDGYFLLNYDASSNQFWDDLIIECTGDGKVMTAGDGSSDIYKNLEFRGSTSPDLNQGSAMRFVGEDDQHIESNGSFNDFSMATLHVEKPNGKLIIDVPLHIQTELNLTNGIIQLSDTNSLFLEYSAIASQGSDSSYVEGAISKMGITEFTFPTGGGGQYAPISIDSVSNSTTFKASYIGTDPNSIYSRSSKDSTLGFVNRCGYWKLERTIGTGTSKAKLGWSNNSCYNSNPVDGKVALWDGSQWKDKGNGAYSGNSTSGNVQSSNSLTSFPAILNVTGVCGLTAGLSANRDTLYSGYLATFTATPANQSNYKFYVNNVLKQDSSIAQFKTHSMVNGDSVKVKVRNVDVCEDEFIYHPFISTNDSSEIGGIFNMIDDSVEVFSMNQISITNSDSVYNFASSLYPDDNYSSLIQIGELDSGSTALTSQQIIIQTILNSVELLNGIPQISNEDTVELQSGLNYLVSESNRISNLKLNDTTGFNFIIYSDKSIHIDSIFNIQSSNPYKLMIVGADSVIVEGSIRDEISIVAHNIVLKNQTRSSRIESKLFANSNIILSNINPLVIEPPIAKIIHGNTCPDYGDFCQKIKNGERFDVLPSPTGFYNPSTLMDNNRVCYWESFSIDPGLIGPIFNNSNNSVAMWCNNKGQGEAMNTTGYNLEVNVNEDVRISFDYRLLTNIPHSTNNLDRLFVILSSNNNPISIAGQFNYYGIDYNTLPFESNAYTTTIDVANNLTYVTNGTDDYVIIELSDLDIISTQNELTNISNFTMHHFNRVFRIPLSAGFSNSQFTSLIIAPRMRYLPFNNAGDADDAAYLNIDNIEVFTCCASQLSVESTITTVSDFSDNQIALNNNTYFNGSTINTGYVDQTNPGPHLLINQDIIVDQNLSITDANIILSDQSSITVKNGATLNISNSWLHGCKLLWESIKVEDGARLIVQRQSLIEDAECAAMTFDNVNIPSQGSLYIYDSKFNKNYKHILIRGNSNLSNNTNYPFELHNSTLSCSGNLLPINVNDFDNNFQINYPRTRYGIEVNNIANRRVLIGDYITSSNMNYIQDAYVGIRVSNSNVFITNNKFSNTHCSYAPGLGCAANGSFNDVTSAIQILNSFDLFHPNCVIGVNSNSGQGILNTFYDHDNGIVGVGHFLFLGIAKNYFEGIYRSGFIGFHHNSSRVIISENEFKKVFRLGIGFRENYGSSIFIRNNIVDNTNLSVDPFPAFGITADNGNTTNLSSWLIESNEIKNFRFGIQLTNIGAYPGIQGNPALGFQGTWLNIIQSNRISLRNGPLTNSESRGITLNNVIRSLIFDNTVFYLGSQNGLSFQTTGYNVLNCPSGLWSCNTAESTNIGFDFRAINGSNRFQGNRMDHLIFGLRLFNSTSGIGPQENTGGVSRPVLNSWVPFSGTSTFSSHLYSFQSNGSSSPFRLYPGNACPTLIASPYNPSNFISNIDVPPSISIPFITNCPVADPITTGGIELKCWTHNNFSTPGITVDIVESIEPTIKYRNKINLLISPDTSNPYASVEKRMIARELFTELLFDSITTLSDTLVSFIDSMSIVPDGIFELLKTSLLDTINIDSLSSDSLILEKMINKSNKLNNALIVNNAISSSDPLIYREKYLNSIIWGLDLQQTNIRIDLINEMDSTINMDSLIQFYQSDPRKNPKFSSIQKDSILTMANDCPFEWGNVVIRARGAASSFDTSIFYINPCEIYFEESARLAAPQKNKIEAQISVYPNPFKEQVTVQLPHEMNAQISIYDITGRLFQSITINKQQQISIPTTNLKQGVYFIEVLQDSNQIYRQKMVKS